ncbi:MAG TPA: hypothetical protein DEF61_03055 [Firmicutes bacterium]|nr:hypothetical protein [Bacillota bacterium]HBX25236.1 hypothetical protein [Bacillota bacterium]
MKKNKWLAFIFFLLSLTSCSSKKENVSIFIYDNEDTFINSLCSRINERFQNGGYEVNQYDSFRSQTLQNKNLLDALEKKKTDLLLVNLVDRLSSSVCMEKATQTNTPLIFFNREPLSSDMAKVLENNENVYFVGANPEGEGRKQAELLLSLFTENGVLRKEYDKNNNGKIDIVLLKGEIGNQDSEKRSEALISTLTKSGTPFSIIDSSYCDWQKEKAKIAMEEIAKKHLSDIEIIVSNNDDMALGAIDYCLENNIFEKGKEKQAFPMISVDGTKTALQYIKDGLLYATVKNDEVKQSKAIYEIGLGLLKNKKIDSSFPYQIQNNHSIYIDGEVITKENVFTYDDIN